MRILSYLCLFLFSGTLPATEPPAFFRSHCAGCHSEAKAEADFRIDKLDPDFAKGKDSKRWAAVLDRVQRGEMPPEDKPRPAAAELKPVIAWLEAGIAEATAAGKDVGKRKSHARLPGNAVDHDALFKGPIAGGVDTAPRVWRLNPEIYREMTQTKGNLKSLPSPFAVDGKSGFKDQADLYVVDEPATQQLLRNAAALVAHRTNVKREEGKLKGMIGTPKEHVAVLDEERPPTDAQLAASIAVEFQLLLKRAPTAEESGRYLALMRRTMERAGQSAGVRTGLAAVYLTPEAVYRFELGTGEVDARGRRTLGQRERAFALAYALTNKGPDKPLLDGAEKGMLATNEQIAAQIDRLWSDPKGDRAPVQRFFREYFGYGDAVDVFKDQKDFKDHQPNVLVADTDRLIRYIVERDRDVLRELLTTNKAFVNFSVDAKRKVVVPAQKGKAVHLSYGLPADWTFAETQPIDLPAAERAGILSQPSWLVAHSLNADNHPILRGKWIREKLLGGTIPDLPISVDAQLPEDPKKTLRERMEVTKQAYCWNCHQKMNDLGLPFEQYDHFGRFRATEIGRPVDRTGLISRSGDAALDGKVDGSLEMIRKLADSDRVRQVFLLHVFRYWLGRNETLGDAESLRAVDDAYVKSGGSLKAALKALLTSDSFLVRVPKSD